MDLIGSSNFGKQSLKKIWNNINDLDKITK